MQQGDTISAIATALGVGAGNTPAIIDDSDESGSSDGKDGASAKNDAGNSADDKSDTGAGSSN